MPVASAVARLPCLAALARAPLTRPGKPYCTHCYAAVAGLKGYGHGAVNESHVSGGAAGESAGAEVLQGADADTPVATGSYGSGLGSGGAKFCASCGGPRTQGAKFCPSCGSAFPQ